METLRHHHYRQCPSSSPISCPPPALTCSAAGRSCAQSPCPGLIWEKGGLWDHPHQHRTGAGAAPKSSSCYSHHFTTPTSLLPQTITCFFSYAESQSGVEETTQSFLGAGIKMEENTNDLHCHLMQSVFQTPLFSEGGSREPPAIIGNDTQLSWAHLNYGF